MSIVAERGRLAPVTQRWPRRVHPLLHVGFSHKLLLTLEAFTRQRLRIVDDHEANGNCSHTALNSHFEGSRQPCVERVVAQPLFGHEGHGVVSSRHQARLPDGELVRHVRQSVPGRVAILFQVSVTVRQEVWVLESVVPRNANGTSGETGADSAQNLLGDRIVPPKGRQRQYVAHGGRSQSHFANVSREAHELRDGFTSIK
mmetsp:Transcript_52657/g.140396  ORF Transcript_52657/g.140396 Transcript_52657/m.140396 type:complete len:201 (-) Transcript_52657:38-640(-)